MRFRLIVLFIFYFFLTSTFAKGKLIFAMDIVRHGDRTPMSEIQTSSYHYWKEGLGQLTPRGMQQEYELGRKFRKKYVDQYHLLSPQYESHTLLVRSTDSDRTLMSAQSLLTGLYPFGTGPLLAHKKVPALPSAYQPIPIHTVPREQDEWVTHLKKKELEHLYVFSTPAWKAKTREVEPKFKTWSIALGKPIANLKHLIAFGTNLYIRQLYHIPLPSGITPEDAKQIIEVGRWARVQMYKPPEIGRATASRALKTITSYLQKASQEKTKWKYVLILAHDSTLLSLMSVMRAPLNEVPAYASHLNFSLYDIGNHQYQIKVRFNDIPVFIPKCGSDSCSLQQFLTL